MRVQICCLVNEMEDITREDLKETRWICLISVAPGFVSTHYAFIPTLSSACYNLKSSYVFTVSRKPWKTLCTPSRRVQDIYMYHILDRIVKRKKCSRNVNIERKWSFLLIILSSVSRVSVMSNTYICSSLPIRWEKFGKLFKTFPITIHIFRHYYYQKIIVKIL